MRGITGGESAEVGWESRPIDPSVTFMDPGIPSRGIETNPLHSKRPPNLRRRLAILPRSPQSGSLSRAYST